MLTLLLLAACCLLAAPFLLLCVWLDRPRTLALCASVGLALADRLSGRLLAADLLSCSVAVYFATVVWAS